MDRLEPDLLERAREDLRAAFDGAQQLPGVVAVHLIFERLLDEQIGRTFPEPDSILTQKSQLRFHQKARLLRSVNLLTGDGLTFLLELNALRNRFAHHLGYELSGDDVKKLSDLCPDVDVIVAGEDDLETKFSKVFSWLVGRIVGEFSGGRLTVESPQIDAVR